jgi:hypothetical protein
MVYLVAVRNDAACKLESNTMGALDTPTVSHKAVALRVL